MNLDYELTGTGEVVIVIATALGSTYAEWRPILRPLEQTHSILLYDRAGYGKSPVSGAEKSPKQAAKALNSLINSVVPGKKYLLAGHSYGGLIAQQYVRDFPQNVVGAIFIDPATTEEDRFARELTSVQYQKSGIDKMRMIRQGIMVGRLRMLTLFKSLLKQSIPFYYYKNYDKATENDILSHFTQLTTYQAMLEEYTIYRDQSNLRNALQEHAFPRIPVQLLLHGSKIMTDEIVNFGGLTTAEAVKIDTLWKSIMEHHYGLLSDIYSVKTSEKSGHYIHLTDPELLIECIREISR